MLNVTKVENQTILTDVTRYNLSEQIRSCVLLLERKWERKHIEMELEFDEYEIGANEELLKLVWINLIDNAIKFSPEYSAVHIRISANGECLTVEVKNTGDPIPAESMERIFHKFIRRTKAMLPRETGLGWLSSKKWWSFITVQFAQTAAKGVPLSRSCCRCSAVQARYER